jgi:hypothetical protein
LKDKATLSVKDTITTNKQSEALQVRNSIKPRFSPNGHSTNVRKFLVFSLTLLSFCFISVNEPGIPERFLCLGSCTDDKLAQLAFMASSQDLSASPLPAYTLVDTHILPVACFWVNILKSPLLRLTVNLLSNPFFILMEEILASQASLVFNLLVETKCM